MVCASEHRSVSVVVGGAMSNSFLLWEKDIFCDPHMVFSDTSKDNIRDVSEIIAHQYSNFGRVINVSQSGAFEANSNNFLAKCTGGDIIVKKINALNRNVDFLIEQFRVADTLYRCGISVPRIIRTDDANVFIQDESSIWCVLEFIDGRYLSGAEDEMISAIKLLDSTFLTLSGMSNAIKLPNMSLLGNASPNVIRNLNADAKIIDQLSIILDEICNNTIELENLRGICHIDFHPHNLIISNGKIFIIDFDAFMNAPIKSMLSFGALKLIRHAMAYRGNFDSELRDDLWECFSKPNKHILSIRGEQAEVFRRLLSILDNTSPGNRSVWEKLIPVHVRCILEAEEIFYHG